MDYLTVAFFRFDHGLKTFFPFFGCSVECMHSNYPCSLWYVLECCCYCTFFEVQFLVIAILVWTCLTVFFSWKMFQVLHRNQLRLFSMSSRRTPCGRTPLTESGLAAFPHPALCETNRSHLSIIYTDIYSGSYQWIAVIYHIQKFYPVVAFLLTPPI